MASSNGSLTTSLGRQVIGSGHYPRQPISEVMEYDFLIPLNGGLAVLRKDITGADELGSVEHYPFTPPRRQLGVFDLIPRTPTRANMVFYVEQTSFTDVATPMIEKSRKPEAGATYVERSTPLATIATWIPVTNRMLADGNVLEAILDTTLVQSLNVELQFQILNGDGVDPNMRGILNTPGISTYPRVAGETVFDAVRKAATLTIVSGEVMPTAVVIHPTDLESLELSGGGIGSTGGGTTFGGGTYGGATPALFGAFSLLTKLTFIQTTAIAQSTALVGAFDVGCMLFDRERGRVVRGSINDTFVRNIQVLRAELEAAFAVLRPAVFTKIVF
jgi:HK97 family phage major capsid protein